MRPKRSCVKIVSRESWYSSLVCKTKAELIKAIWSSISSWLDLSCLFPQRKQKSKRRITYSTNYDYMCLHFPFEPDDACIIFGQAPKPSARSHWIVQMKVQGDSENQFYRSHEIDPMTRYSHELRRTSFTNPLPRDSNSSGTRDMWGIGLFVRRSGSWTSCRPG